MFLNNNNTNEDFNWFSHWTATAAIPIYLGGKDEWP